MILNLDSFRISQFHPQAPMYQGCAGRSFFQRGRARTKIRGAGWGVQGSVSRVVELTNIPAYSKNCMAKTSSEKLLVLRKLNLNLKLPSFSTIQTLKMAVSEFLRCFSFLVVLNGSCCHKDLMLKFVPFPYLFLFINYRC